MSGCVTLLMSVALMLMGMRRGQKLMGRGGQAGAGDIHLLHDWESRRNINDGACNIRPEGFLFSCVSVHFSTSVCRIL